MNSTEIAEVNAYDYIKVTQLPVIEEQLRMMKAEVQRITQEALELDCTPETLADVKAARADLTKAFSRFEDQRKVAKKAISTPYDNFLGIYKDCIADPFQAADAALREKIGAVESEIIGKCRDEMQAYFQELCEAEHIDWLEWERVPVKIGLSEAKQKRHTKLRQEIAAFVVSVSQACNSIAGMDDADEIMVEYQRGLDLACAIGVVADRHRRIQAEREAAEARAKAQEADQQAAAKVQAAAPAPAPVPVQAPAEPEKPEKIYKLTFSVKATKPLLIKFKAALIDFCQKEGIDYE